MFWLLPLLGVAGAVIFGSSDEENKKSANVTSYDDEYERKKRRQADEERKERVQKWNHLIDGYVTDLNLKNSRLLHVGNVTDITQMIKEIENETIFNKYMTYRLAKSQHQQAVNTLHQIDKLIQELS
jgi:hypothetical protein